MLSPKGTAVYPHLNTPDTKFNPDGEYKVTLRVSGDEGQTFAAQLDELVAQAEADAIEETGKKKVKLANPPYEVDDETGDILVKFKSKASGTSRRTGEKWSRRIPLVDAQRNPCPGAKVGGGSELIVAFEPFIYYTASIGAGVSLRIQAVQVVTLQEWGSSASSLFGEVEGFVSDDSHAEPVAVASEEADADDDEDYEF